MILLYCFLLKIVLTLPKSITNDTYCILANMTNEEIIKIIKERKDILRINQDYLAELSEIGIATLKRFESGKGNITLNNLQKITDILGLELKLELKKSNK
jgi:hypothetical protein